VEHHPHAVALVEVQSAGEGWRGTLATLDDEVAQGIKFYIQAGVSQGALADFYGVTATQVRSVASALKDEAAALRIEETALAATTKLWNEYDASRVSQGGTATDAQIAQIHRWADDLVATTKKAGADTTAFYDALAAVTAQKLSGITVNWQALGAASQEALQQAYEKAQATLEQASSGSLTFSQAAMQHFRDVRDAALEALHGITPALKESETALDSYNDKVMGIETSFKGWNAAIMETNDALDKNRQKSRAAGEAAKQANLDMGNTIDTATAAQDPVINEYLKAGWSLKNAEALKLAKQYGFTPKLFDERGNPETAPSPSERVPGYAGGVTGAPGGWAMVGEKGPELVNLPPTSNVIPFGGGGGGASINLTFNVNGTGAQVAQQIKDVIMRQLKSQRQFGAA